MTAWQQQTGPFLIAIGLLLSQPEGQLWQILEFQFVVIRGTGNLTPFI